MLIDIRAELVMSQLGQKGEFELILPIQNPPQYLTTASGGLPDMQSSKLPALSRPSSLGYALRVII